MSKRALLFRASPLPRLADAGADGGDHRLDFLVLENLVEPRFLDVDQLAADRQDRLITAVASLLGRAAGGIALDNVELGQLRIALGAVGQFAGQAAAGERAFADRLAGLARGLAGAGGREHLVENRFRHRRVLVEEGHQALVNDRVDDAVDLGVHQLHLGLRFEPRIRQLDAQDADQSFAHIVAGDRWDPFPS